MKTEMQVTFRGMEPSPAVEQKVRQEAEKLERYFDRIIGCRVVIEMPQHRHHQGNIFHVQIDLKLPGEELVVNRDGSDNHAHEDVYVAIRDAFDAAQRRVMDHAKRLRLEAKGHDSRGMRPGPA